MSPLDLRIAKQLAEALPAADFRHIVETFGSDLRRLSAQLEAAIEAGDIEAYRRAAHAMAGAAGAVGAMPLERIARVAMDPRAGVSPPDLIPLLRGEAAASLAALNSLADGTEGIAFD